MKDLIFWVPFNGVEQQIIIPKQYVQTIMIPAAEHEAGHLIAAHHYGARVRGICVGFVPELNQRGMFLLALYESTSWPVETHCIVKAAGSAADVLYFGGFTEAGARGDVADIEKLTGNPSLEPYLNIAKEVLTQHADQVKCITALLRRSLESGEERTLGMVPGGHVGTLLVGEEQLMGCMTRTVTPQTGGNDLSLQ